MSDEQAPQAQPESEPEAVEKPASNIGRIEWLDLTVHDAPKIRDFYKSVVGWKSEDVDMGTYADYNINLPGSGDTIAGVCHARGQNANLPTQWLIYVRVEDVATSAATCEAKGGKVIDGPRRMGGSDFCVIQDPAGAVMALLSDKPK
ncbi:MAG: VOC family protein [Gammaproteobacteria bacterium]